MEYVWVFGANAVASQDNQLFAGQSRVFVQVCVPLAELFAAHQELEEFLKAERFERSDVWSARRYDISDDTEDYPGDYLKRDALRAAKTGECILSVYVLSNAEASFRDDADA